MENKSIKTVLLIVVSAILLTGCFLQSVHPLVAPQDSILVDGVVGVWEDDEQLWIFARPDDIPGAILEIEGFEDIEEDLNGEASEVMEHGYLVVHRDKKDHTVSTFIAHFVELDRQLYLDLYPLNTWTTGLLENHYFPVHTFSKIELHDGKMDIRLFKSSWIKKQIEDNRVRIKHEKSGDGVLITASTIELQRFVERYGRSDEAFENPIALQKAD